MSLSQGQLDRMGREAFRMYGSLTEMVRYSVKATLNSTPVIYRVAAYIDEYRLSALVNEAILPTDRRARTLQADVSWQPTDYDEITRTDGSVWRVQSVSGGPGHSFYMLQLRQVA